MVRLNTVREFVNQLFVRHREIVTPQQELMFKELVKQFVVLTPMRAVAQNFAAYNNLFLFYMMDCIEKRYINVVVVPKVMRSRNFFESIYSFWMDFESKLGFIYQKLYEINHEIEANLHGKLIGSPIMRRTLTIELFINKVLHNNDVNQKLRRKAVDRENLDESEVMCFRLVCQKFSWYRQEPRNELLLIFLERNLPYLPRDV